MAFASVGTLGSVQAKTSLASITLTTSAALQAGNLGVIIFSFDNIGTADGDNSEVSGVVDSAGNIWSKIAEYTNGEGVAGNGATCSVWQVVAPVELASGGTIVATLTGAVAARAASAWEFTLARSAVLRAAFTRAANDLADPAAVNLTSLPSKEYLFVHGLAIENPNSGAYTEDADYSSFDANGTTGGVGATNIMCRGGFRIATLTADTVNVAGDARDSAAVYAALEEYEPLTAEVGAETRVLVGDRFGRLLAELTPLLGPVSWRLNDVGQASFLISAGDDKATGVNLAWGNRVYIDFDNGLPPWGGVIDGAERWENGMISVSCYSGEYILSQRQTIRDRAFEAQKAGEIFQTLIMEANGVDDTGISIGEVWGSGDAYNLTLHFGNLLTAIRNELCGKLSDADFEIAPQLANGKISFTANLYERRGRVKKNVALLQAHNTAAEILIKQGKIVNWWDIAGSGGSWGADRLTASAIDTESIAAYGLRQDTAIFGEVISQETLDLQAATLLAASKEPAYTYSLSAHNLAPAAFAAYDVGDTVRLMWHSYGFEGTDANVRLLTREYNPASGLCNLVVEEVSRNVAAGDIASSPGFAFDGA